MKPETFEERAAERAKSLIGRVIDDRYQIDRVLAMGGMGTVYLARHKKLKKRVALKVLHPDAEDHPELFLRFEREAQAGAQVNHPNVASATDFGELEDNTRYLVLEYVRGQSLRAVIDAQAPLGPLRAATIGRQIAVALSVIHDKGIVHRDIKPRNVMVSDNDVVKIVDFGLAKIETGRVSAMSMEDANEGARLTEPSTIFGTVEYLAPEAALGMEFIDARADLYALGIVLYEMLTGKHPFEGGSDVEVFAAQRTKPAPPFAHRAPTVVVPDELEQVVMKLLAKDLETRFQTAAEVIAALDAAIPDARHAPVEAPPSSEMFSSRPAALPSTAPATSQENRPQTDPPPTSAPKPEKDGVPSTKRSGKAAAVSPPPSSAASREEPPKTEPATKRRMNALALAGIGGILILAVVAISQSTTAPAPSESTPVATSSAPPLPTFTSVVTSAHVTTASATSAPLPQPSASESAAPSASVAPSTSASAAVEAPLDPEALAAILPLLKTDLAAAAGRSLELLRAHPTLLKDKTGATTMKKVLGVLIQKAHPRLEEVAMAIGTTQETSGPDFFYELVEVGGKSAVAQLATKALNHPDIVAKTSPATRIAFQLRTAPCNEKLTLLDRAATEGDERSIVVLDIQARGCFKDARRVDAALETLKKRLDPNRK